MNPGRWDKIQSLFEKAVELNQHERKNFLKTECGDDKELFDEVISLLEADEKQHSIFSGSAADYMTIDDEALEGKTFGNYRAIKQVGSGGMGSVYLAERADGVFEQKVALKIVKPGLNSREIISRFEEERQILARLQHPNIARLLDGGISEPGLPYFTMEYVEGKPITEYCDEHNLTIEQRLGLFKKVCEAVLYAHQNLVIHRDIKPGNILVQENGTVKLLDFGIAKVFEEAEDQKFVTRTGMRVMTPDYASPEQVRGEPVSTATDIYSLGLILYQLMSGCPPYEIKSASALEMERIICLTEPQKPSMMVTKIFSSKTAGGQEVSPDFISGKRRTAIPKLKKKISGDLDNICLMAIRKEPERRYSSIAQLITDIDNHLTGLPVTARKSTTSYRAKKFIKRHRVGVVFTSVAVFVIALVTAFYTIQLAEERDKAKLEAEKSAKVSEFLQDIFKFSEPSESRGQTVTARELLDLGAQKIETEMNDQPEIQATMLEVIGRVYMALGLYEESEPLLERSLKLRSKLFGAYHLETSKSLNSLGELFTATGNYEKAELLLIKAAEIQNTELNEYDIEKIKAMNNLALNYGTTGIFDKSDSLYRKILNIYQKNNIKKSETLFSIMNNLALSLHETGNYSDADSLFRIAYELQKNFYGNKPHPELATTTYNFAQLLRDKGNYAEAEKMFRESLEMDKILNGPEHPDVAYSLQGLASIYRIRGKYDEAEKLYRESLQIRRKFLGNEHPDVGYSLYSLGLILIETKKLDEAEKIFNEALVIQKKLNGEEHQAVTNIYDRLAEINFQKGNYSKAENLLTKAIKINFKIIGEKHLGYASKLVDLAKVKSATKDYDTAIVLCNRGIEIALEIAGEEAPFLTGSYSILARIYFDKGDYKASDSAYRKSLQLHQKIYGLTHIRTAITMTKFAALLVKTDSVKQAYSFVSEGLKILQQNPEVNPVDIASAESILGEVLSSMNNYSGAEKLLLNSYSVLSSEMGDKNRLTISTVKMLVKNYELWGKQNQAKKFREILSSSDAGL